MSTSYSGFTLQESEVDREKRYCEFYSKVIHEYFGTEPRSFVSDVIDVLKSGIVLSSENNSECYQCAYLLQFGARETCFAVKTFYESVMAYSNIIETFVYKNRINICCFGSRALFAVVGLCHVIDESVKQFGFLDEIPTTIQVFIIEKNGMWKKLSEYITAAKNKELTKVKIKSYFLTENLQQKFTEEVKLRINKSHILTMVKYLSQVDSSKAVQRIIKNAGINMKKNSVFFYLDQESAGHFTTLKSNIMPRTEFSHMMSSQVPEKYLLSKKTKPVHTKLYQDVPPLDSFWNIDSAPLMHSTWIKRPEIKTGAVAETKTVKTDEESHKRGCRAKTSNNTLRNSDKKYRLVGKFARIDMEKKNKPDHFRQKAKSVSVSRHADFNDLCCDEW